MLKFKKKIVSKRLKPSLRHPLCHKTRSSPIVQFCPDAMRPVADCGLFAKMTNCLSSSGSFWQGSNVRDVLGSGGSIANRVYSSCGVAILCGWVCCPWRKKTESGCRVSEQHISAVLINSADRSSKTNLLTKELPHCERFGLVLHHETNLVI